MPQDTIYDEFVQSRFLRFVDNGRAPRHLTDYGFMKKLGIVNHRPVTSSLSALTGYFNGGNAKGSTHFGVGRERAGILEWEDSSAKALVHVPVAFVDQYMPITRTSEFPNGCSPWAQGNIRSNPNCPIQPMAPILSTLNPQRPNGAFISIENCDWDGLPAGSPQVTDEEFNSNVLMRAYCADLFDFPINPSTQLWHAEIDQATRCNDPGWEGALENEMQRAANQLLEGDWSGLRLVRSTPLSPPASGPTPAQPSPSGPDLAALKKELEQTQQDLAQAVAIATSARSRLKKLLDELGAS